MTGFGKAEGHLKNKKISIQVRSLNSKQTDIGIKVPSAFKEKEIEMRNLLSNKLLRGKIELYLSIEDMEGETAYEINEKLFKKYYSQLKTLSKELGESSTELMKIVAGLPEVFKNAEIELSQADWASFFTILGKAIDEHIVFRNKEGEVLQNDLISRIKAISGFLEKVGQYEDERIEIVRERISKNLDDLKSVDANKERFEQEMIYYLEKYDITEEKVRLKMHLNYFQETMEEENSQGKKLGFIAQEIGREINTMGAKANHSAIQVLVVQMKDELEKIKEQILNIL